MTEEEKRNNLEARRAGSRKKDRDIGAMIRILRKQKGMSLKKLGEHLGVKYQQVQKYECGKDRVSAGTLHTIAEALEVPVLNFYEDVTDTLPSNAKNSMFIQVARLAGAMEELGPEFQRALERLIRAMRNPPPK